MKCVVVVHILHYLHNILADDRIEKTLKNLAAFASSLFAKK